MWVDGLRLSHSSKVDSGWLTREQSISLDTGECIGNYIVRSRNVMDVGGELRYVVQLTRLTRRVTIRASVQCKCEGFVISEYLIVPAFEEMAEVFDRKIHSQQFPVEGAVASWRRRWDARYC